MLKMQVRKRDGRLVSWDRGLITRAIVKAMQEINYTNSEIANIVSGHVEGVLITIGNEIVDISNIVELVELTLMESYPEVGNAYISFRRQRDIARAKNSDMVKNVLGVLENTDDSVMLENANKAAEIIPTMRDLVAGTVSKQLARDHILPNHITDAHDNGEIHYHDLDYAPAFPMFNCFDGDTKFISSTGVYSFNELGNGAIVSVPSHTGRICRAKVVNYGKQNINEVTLTCGRGTQTVYVTDSHRWILRNEECTTSLKVGDKLAHTPNIRPNITDAKSWVRGFVFGDGTKYNSTSSRVRICGNKSKYRKMFEVAGYNVTQPESYNGDLSVIMPDITKGDLTGIDIPSFVEGYIAADGSFRDGVVKSIQATGQESFDVIEKLFDVAGYYIGTYQTLSKPTNFGNRRDETRQYTIRGFGHMGWTVKSINRNVKTDDVWCLEVENDHSFILQGGVVTGNCMLVNLEEMFTNGFKMGNAEIETPRSISTACSITAQIIAQVASHIYGGTSLDRLDIVLAPYVRASYEKHLQCAYEWGIEKAEDFAEARTEKECFDAFQALEYEVNTLHTANGQTPFVTFAFGRGTSWESRLIQQSILRNRINGLGKHHKTATFPKLVFYVEDCINRRKDDPNHDIKRLALECSSRRMYPDYLNVEALKRVTGSVKAPMGCRSFLGQWDDADGNEVHDGRNNLGVVSLNLVRIAIESGGDFVKFWELMRKRTELVHEALETRIDRLRGVKAKVAPVLYCEGAMGVRLDPEDEVMQLFENGRASISMGYIGLCEVAHAMFGAGPETDHAASEFCKDVVKFMKQKVDDWKAESGFGYSLYATPSENLCDRFCRIDREQFGVIEGVNDKEYYTNSFHTDVQYKTDPFTKFDLESVYPPFSSGGFISYAEFPSMLHNIDGLELVLDHTRDHNPYVAFNTPTDDCYLCGWSGETKVGAKGFECPNCGNRDLSKMSVIRRVCGYLGGERGVNHGKLEEMRRRVKHV